MNLLISETRPDAVLDRAIPWMIDVEEYVASLALDDESSAHEGRMAAGPGPAWYDVRLSVLRQVIMDPY